MARVTRIVALSGSLRRQSVNTALLREIAAGAPDGVAVEIVSLEALPLFNPDLEPDLPHAVTAFRGRIAAADALVIASPEYAHGVSGVIKNALDWLVASEDFAGKPVAVLNAAPRAHHADTALRETLSTMAARVVEKASVTVPLPNAAPCHPATNEMLTDALAALVTATRRTMPGETHDQPHNNATEQESHQHAPANEGTGQ
ncbi:MAG: NAD(P)H-dependent oxidoreductase [Sphingomonas sp.]|jgi:NAD(P)H-dependent FMN reductase|uniref:NADPH-dependent FMN reductase n=1 Tax=Sphingomonas sp. TaxID=28214 RepID=UPI003563ACBA